MPQLPNDAEFIGDVVDEASFKAKQVQMLGYLRDLLGNDGLSSTALTQLGISNAPARLGNIENVVGNDGLSSTALTQLGISNAPARLGNIENVVGTDGTAATARQALGLASLTLDYVDTGAWITNRLYHVNEQFTQGGIAYLVTVQHTSTVFSADETSGFFVIQQGLNHVTGLQRVGGIAVLRTITPTAGRSVYCDRHTTQGDGGHGVFRAVVGKPAGYFTVITGTEPENNGTIIVPSGGDGSAAWVRDKVFDDVREFGLNYDGITDDTASVQAAVNSSNGEALLPLKKRILVTNLVNDLGIDLIGDGEIVKTVAGGFDKLNSYADLHTKTFGQEYLAAFHNLLHAQSTSPTRKPIVVFSGDSTTAGVSATTGFYLHELFNQAAENAGLQTAYGTNVINRGQSGQTTIQWNATHLAGDLAVNPDLLILRWGINDPGWLKDGTTPPLDAGKDFPNRNTEIEFITALRAGLTTARAARSLNSLSIILMSPSATYDTPNGRDALYYERIHKGIKKAARDFQCCYIDTYGLFRDVKGAGGFYQDNPFGDGRGIHPLNVMNTWIMTKITDMVYPETLRNTIGVANIKSICGAQKIVTSADLPASFSKGVSINRVASGFPHNGNIITFRSSDETLMQINFPYKSADSSNLSWRVGRSLNLSGNTPVWESWQIFGVKVPVSVLLTALAGFSMPATGGARLSYDWSGNSTEIDGYIEAVTPAIVPAGTIVATLPVLYSPTIDSNYTSITLWDGNISASNFQQILAVITQAGEIKTLVASNFSVKRIYLSSSYSRTS